MNFQKSQEVDFSLIKEVIQRSSFKASFRKLGNPTVIQAAIPDFVFCEHPVLIARLGEKSKAFFSTGCSFSADLKAGKNMLTDEDSFDMDSFRLSSYQDIFERETFPKLANLDPDHRYLWKRCYYGLLTAETAISPVSGKACIVGGMQGENKNGSYGISPQYITTTILPFGTFTQPEDGVLPYPKYYGLDEVYFSFIGLTYLEAEELEKADCMEHDLGPVIWPSAGYLSQSNEPQSLGVAHPYLIRHDGYLYLFYSEELYQGAKHEEGRRAGIKVARAPEDDWRPENFRNWYQGGFTERSLPEGFDRYDRRFVYECGGKSTPIIAHPNGHNINCFSVAKLRGTNQFLGVSWDRVQNSWLWLSDDLVNWRLILQVPYFGWTTLNYPILCNSDFTNQKEIDPHDFYIMGTNHQQEPKVVALHVSLDIS